MIYNFGYCPICGERVIHTEDMKLIDHSGEFPNESISCYCCQDCNITLEVHYCEYNNTTYAYIINRLF